MKPFLDNKNWANQVAKTRSWPYNNVTNGKSLPGGRVVRAEAKHRENYICVKYSFLSTKPIRQRSAKNRPDCITDFCDADFIRSKTLDCKINPSCIEWPDKRANPLFATHKIKLSYHWWKLGVIAWVNRHIVNDFRTVTGKLSTARTCHFVVCRISWTRNFRESRYF